MGRKFCFSQPRRLLLEGGLVWRAGRRGSTCALPSPWRVCCAPHPCWGTGCTVGGRASSSHEQSSAGQATSCVASRVSPAGSTGLSSSRRRRGNCCCSPLPSARAALQLTCCLRLAFVAQPVCWRRGAQRQLPLLSLRAGLAKQVPEAAGVLCSPCCHPGPKTPTQGRGAAVP